jgi:hypothetical protein
MQKAAFVLLILSASHLLFADEDSGELYTCSFIAHTPVGALSGDCTTQSLPDANSVSRWKMTLAFDQQSSGAALNLKVGYFYDMVRGQCLADGSFTTVMPLWGDLVLTPNDSDYLASNKACSPSAQTVPTLITVSRTSAFPLTLALLFDERRVDFDVNLGLPTFQWFQRYLESFRRLGGNPVAAAVRE